MSDTSSCCGWIGFFSVFSPSASAPRMNRRRVSSVPPSAEHVRGAMPESRTPTQSKSPTNCTADFDFRAVRFGAGADSAASTHRRSVDELTPTRFATALIAAVRDDFRLGSRTDLTARAFEMSSIWCIGNPPNTPGIVAI
ncbi:MAG TPA: hypothetical protein VN133_05290, partial [Humibacter sp.]|nr:hypothetical protein [Humibacter sp.]